VLSKAIPGLQETTFDRPPSPACGSSLKEDRFLGAYAVTIRNKLLLTMSLVLALIAFFGLAYYKSLVTIRNRFTILESIDDLGVAASDMRRDEKNYLLYRDRTSADNWIEQVNFTRQAIKDKAAELTELGGADYCRKLMDSISSYAALAMKLVSSKQDAAGDAQIRAQGHDVYEYSRGIVRAERERIDALVRSSHNIFLFSLPILMISGLVGAVVIARDIAVPLRKIERATRQVSEGKYVPIDGVQSQDEIGKLARAFNHMVQQIEKHQEELVQAGKLASLGTLTSGVAHELNNPLNNISMIAQTFLKLFDSLGDAERIEFMSQIDTQCERAREIVVSLLDFSRVRPRTFASADIGQVVRESLKLVENELALNNIECVLKMAQVLPPVRINANRIKQVLINVLTNAIKSMAKGGRLVVEAALAGDLRHVNVAITDTGTGIPAEILPRIFDPFFSTPGFGEGTGLGLSVSYGIIKRHGGTISVRSEQGKGSTFTVALPIWEEEAENGTQAEDSGRR